MPVCFDSGCLNKNPGPGTGKGRAGDFFNDRYFSTKSRNKTNQTHFSRAVGFRQGGDARGKNVVAEDRTDASFN